MKKIYVKLNTFSSIKALVCEANQIEGKVTIYKDHYVVDGKSIMGVLSLDLTTGVIIEYPETAKTFDLFISTFKADEE